VQSTPEKSNESSEEKQEETHEESNSIPSEGLVLQERALPTRFIQDIAATRIQNAFRALLVHNLQLNFILPSECSAAIIVD